MARRGAGKAKARSVASRGQRNTGTGAPGSASGATLAAEVALMERLAAVERERDALLAALTLEQERRRRLEEAHAAVRDRIAWALDSLQSILEAKG